MNINRLLGESGYDESIDMTFWTNTFINNRAIDGKAANKTEEEQKVKPHIQTKYLLILQMIMKQQQYIMLIIGDYLIMHRKYRILLG